MHRSFPWAAAVNRTRSAEGFLERVRRGEPITSALHRVLTHTLNALIADGVIPDQDPDYAALLWATLFDERMLVDLTSTLGWQSDEVADALSTQLKAALRAPNQPRGGSRLRVSSSSSA